MRVAASLFRKAGEALESLFSLVMPDRCVVCGKRLAEGEHVTCTACSVTLPYTRFSAIPGNPVERLLTGCFPLGRAGSWIFYRQHSGASRLLAAMKYHHRPDVAEELGRRMAASLTESGFFSGIDLIVPIPLSPKRLKKRGYNQSAMIARGINLVTGIQTGEDILKRTVDNPTQTHLTVSLRISNVKDIFSLPHPEAVRGKHILLTDDVITTGATVTSAADVLTEAGAKRISVLTLASAASIAKR